MLPEFFRRATSSALIDAFFRVLGKYQDFDTQRTIHTVLEFIQDVSLRPSLLSTSHLQFLSTYIGVDGFALEPHLFSEPFSCGRSNRILDSKDLSSMGPSTPRKNESHGPPDDTSEGSLLSLGDYSVETSDPFLSHHVVDGGFVAVFKPLKGTGSELIFVTQWEV